MVCVVWGHLTMLAGERRNNNKRIEKKKHFRYNIFDFCKKTFHKVIYLFWNNLMARMSWAKYVQTPNYNRQEWIQFRLLSRRRPQLSGCYYFRFYVDSNSRFLQEVFCLKTSRVFKFPNWFRGRDTIPWVINRQQPLCQSHASSSPFISHSHCNVHSSE